MEEMEEREPDGEEGSMKTSSHHESIKRSWGVGEQPLMESGLQCLPLGLCSST